MNVLNPFSAAKIHRNDKDLFDYQREMKGAIYGAWGTCTSVMCQMPTGTGKTHLLVSVVRDFVQTWKMPVWIVAHRIELIEQISETLTRYGVPNGRITSGSTVSAEQVQVASIQTLASLWGNGKISFVEKEGMKRTSDWRTLHNEATPEIADENRRMQDDVSFPKGIGEHVKEVEQNGTQENAPFPKDIRTNVKGMEQDEISGSRAGHWKYREPGLVVIDEAHHALAGSYQLLWKHFPDAYKLGLTATPCRLNKRGFTSLFDRLLTSWSISRFIEEGRLALFDYLSICSQSEAQRRIDSLSKRGADGDFSIKEMGMVMDCPEAIEQLYRSYKTFAGGKKGIIYAINRAHSLHICDYYRKQGVKIESIDSKTPAWERVDKVERYRKGEVDVIVNVDIFSEGFDCPAVEFIQLARPTLSLSKYLQQVGRGLRVHPDKVRAIILDQVGLYRLFGLPTEERNWQQMFVGKMAGKGVNAVERELFLEQQEFQQLREEQPQRKFQEVRDGEPMLIIQGHTDFLRLVANRKAEVEPFEQKGLFGLRKGEMLITPPTYPYIAPFIGNYAVITHPGGRFGLITNKGNVLPLPKCLKIELYPEEFAYIEESPVIRYYLDLKNFRHYDSLPTTFKLDFLEFACYKGLYYLRFRYLLPLANPVFRAEELTVDGDVFFHSGYFIHRGEPHKLYQYNGYDEQGRLLIMDGKSDLFAYQRGESLLYCGKMKSVWNHKQGCWKRRIVK